MAESRLGSKVRALRRRNGLTQAKLAENLGISTSYLNLIENNRRPLSASVLIKIAQLFQVDLQTFSSDEEGELLSQLMEVFGDPIFDPYELSGNDVRELASQNASVGRAVLGMYRSYREARESMQSLASHLSDGRTGGPTMDAIHLPTEEVSDFVQRNSNYFPDLEAGAEKIRQVANIEHEDLFTCLSRYLHDHHGIRVKIKKIGSMKGAIRRFDKNKRILYLSEVLRRGSRNFQLAHQIGLMTQGDTLTRLSQNEILTNADSRALCRVALANYFAGAVLMPYQEFLDAARAERYDIELLGHRFRTSFEQVCHRLTSLRRKGAEGVPFHLVRIDIAGNISKRFTASGLRFARYNAACPRWNVHKAFTTPGMIRVQLSTMPDGRNFFCIARTLEKSVSGYRSEHHVQAIGMGCDVRFAEELVYSDGMDLSSDEASLKVGITCRLCERMDCEQRAFPPLQHPLQINENVRGASFFAPVGEERPIKG